MFQFLRRLLDYEGRLTAYVFVIQQVSFFCSPLRKDKFNLRERRKSRFKSNGVELEKDVETWHRMLLENPLKLLELVKKYQSVSTRCIIFYLLHLLLLYHQTIKAVIYSTFVGTDQAKIDYLTSLYYPIFTTNFQKSHLFTYLILIFSSHLLITRTICTLRVLTNSVKNERTYESLNISQLNFGESITLGIPLFKYFKLLADHTKHMKDIRTNKEVREAHYKVWDAEKHEQLKSLSPNEMIYDIGVIDFKECLSETVSKDFKAIKDRWDRRDSIWHRAQSRPRNELFAILWGCLIVFLSVPFATSLYLCYAAAILDLELRKSFGDDDITLSAALDHIKQPAPIIRILEGWLLGVTVVPPQFEASLIYFDMFTLRMRIEKLKNAMKLKLESCQDTKLMRKDQKDSLFGLPITYKLRAQPGTRRELEKSTQQWAHRMSLLKDLNLEVRDQVKMAKFLYMEFDNIRRQHFVYMNLLIVFSGLSSAFCLSVYFFSRTSAEIFIAVSFLGLSIIPTMNALIFFAGVERSFKDLYITMTHLLVNELHLLDHETIRSLLVGSRIFMRKEDRSIVIFNLYAITLDSVGPFIAFMLTAAVFFNRFIFFDDDVE